MAISLADKLPTGSSDPYEIRKQVFWIMDVLVENKIDLDLSPIIEKSFEIIMLELQQDVDRQETLQNV